MVTLNPYRTLLVTGLATFSLSNTGCNGASDTPGMPDSTLSRTLLSPAQHLVRVSVALRGLRPDAADLDAVRNDPEALGPIVDRYLESAEFGETLRTMHAELYLTRNDADSQLPSLGVVSHRNAGELYQAASEEPLRLVEHIVTQGRPYTEVVTADYMVANEVLAEIYGLSVPNGTGESWVPTRWVDGRPHSGILSSSQIFRRHVSAGSNFHRLRANFLAEALLCESFADRDVVVEGGIDLTDESQVANAVSENPNCVACHQAMDPLASALWGYKRQLDPRAIEGAEAEGCWLSPDFNHPFANEFDDFGESQASDYCYPLVLYNPVNEDNWADFALRAPGYYGVPVVDLVDLGQQIAADPRFAQCATRRFLGWFTQQDPLELPDELVAELQQSFVDSGFDARDLTRRIVLSGAFQAAQPSQEGDAGLQVLRAEAYANVVEQYTGFRWEAWPDGSRCEPYCWGAVDLANSDRYGFRAMAGGVDGFRKLEPTHRATPTRVLVMDRLASEAAGSRVDADLERPVEERLLLRQVERTTTDEATVRAQLRELHHTILGAEVTTPDDIDETWALFSDAHQRTSDPAYAWKLVVSLLLQDPRLLYY